MGADRHVRRKLQRGAEKGLGQELNAAEICAVEIGRALAVAQRSGEFLEGSPGSAGD